MPRGLTVFAASAAVSYSEDELKSIAKWFETAMIDDQHQKIIPLSVHLYKKGSNYSLELISDETSSLKELFKYYIERKGVDVSKCLRTINKEKDTYTIRLTLSAVDTLHSNINKQQDKADQKAPH
ncbi:hypothetical protein Lste_3152 [Legionella steelei]|uniref:Uncharacterized protein n=1 Tax=Legionella steelei TaxID=947033 RepID=A0A0W0ZCL1_9GAMM|nr:hypothetical protein [Legionella steelei]KTD66946.1 hypothetical protein Lste_3152 [Legionella steelei]